MPITFINISCTFILTWETFFKVFEESGIHYFEDGHFWVEVPGLPTMENVEDLYHIPPKAKQKNRVKFSSDPIKVCNYNLDIYALHIVH